MLVKEYASSASDGISESVVRYFPGIQKLYYSSCVVCVRIRMYVSFVHDTPLHEERWVETAKDIHTRKKFWSEASFPI